MAAFLPRFQHLLPLVLLLLTAGAALAMPGDVDEEGFCIDGDIVAGFCLGPQHSEEVMGRTPLLCLRSAHFELATVYGRNHTFFNGFGASGWFCMDHVL